MDLPFDPRDPEIREALAAQAYYKERSEEAAQDREHSTNENVSYMVLSWESLSDFSRRPYRTAIWLLCDLLASNAAV